MRVAIVIGELNSRSGPSVNGARLARALTASGQEVALVHCTPPSAMAEGLVQEFSDRLLALPCVHPLDPRWAGAFLRHVRRLRPQLVHLNTQTQAMVLAPLARLSGAAVVYTMRNLLEYNNAWIRHALKVVTPRFVNRMIGVSEAVTDNIRLHRLSRTEPLVIYNGVEPPEFGDRASARAEVRRELDIRDDQVVVGTCSRLSSDKAQIHLIEAAVLLKGRDFSMIVVGDGEMREPMEELCAREGLANVHFLGWRTDVPRFLAAMDVFAFHSMPEREGLPTVVTEAAMAGLPLVVADIQCLREVYTDGEDALFAGPGASDEFAAQIDRMLTSPELRGSLGARASEIARGKFSIETMTESYLDLFHSYAS